TRYDNIISDCWYWYRYSLNSYRPQTVRQRRYCTIYFTSWLCHRSTHCYSSFIPSVSANYDSLFTTRFINMDIIHIVLFAITSAMIYLIVKEVQPNIAFVILFITAIIIFIFIIEQVKTIISFIQILARKASIQTYYLDTIFKIIGIAYIVEIAANLVKDAGLSSLASKIELAGKIFILLLALPIIQAVIEMIIQFIPASSH